MTVLDRFEGDFAVIEEDGIIKTVPKNQVDKAVTEGSVIVKKNDMYFLDENETAARRKKIAELQNSLFED